MKRILFVEEQFMRQPWVWAILLITLGTMLGQTAVGFYYQFYLGQPWGNNPASNETLLWTGSVELVVAVALIVSIAKMKLVTLVKNDGFYFRYPPFILKERRIGKNEIESFEIRKYKPIREYGGWGIRLGSRKAGRAYNIKGNIGLQLVLKSNRRILFGTQRAEALKRAMKKMMQETG